MEVIEQKSIQNHIDNHSKNALGNQGEHEVRLGKDFYEESNTIYRGVGRRNR